jgi:Fic family protein
VKVPLPPPLFSHLSRSLDVERLAAIVTSGIEPTDRDQYRHWDTLRHLQPPQGLTLEEWWFGVKFARSKLRRDLPLRDTAGRSFGYALTDALFRMLHQIDQRASGAISVSEVVTNASSRDRYLVSSLIEEAVTSSQLEGASTTGQVAREMLRSGRPPATHGERMILANYRAMEFVRSVRTEPMSIELLLALHGEVTAGTLDPAAAGRFQTSDDERVGVYWNDATLLHTPPPAEQLPERMGALCAFANGLDGETFVHPVARAVLLHFWLAYDHPFEDGNGRAARAVFYWAMLHQGYWLTEYLSISSILRRAPARYAKSFLYVETDDNDVTYFLLAQLRVIQRAIDALHAFLERKMCEVRNVEDLLRRAPGFNHRQLALLGHALRHPDGRYTFDSHRRSHNVAYQSARTDLLALEDKGLLERVQYGRAFHFFPVGDLAERLGSMSA